jgi:hypothetical protein
MVLRGGLVRPDGSVDRGYAWRAVDGTVETALAAAAHEHSRPEAVSQALVCALDLLGGERATRARVDSLSVPDRRYLMAELAGALGLSFSRSIHVCSECREPFHVPLDLARLPVYPAGGGNTSADVITTAGRVRVRVPTGADQIRIAQADDDAAAARLLVALCVAPADGPSRNGTPAQFSAEDLVAIDAALDELAPNLPWAAEAPCPECGHVNVIPIDVAGWLTRLADGPTADVHEIATAYGWSEREILALTRTQRLKYLALIRRWRDEPQPN